LSGNLQPLGLYHKLPQNEGRVVPFKPLTVLGMKCLIDYLAYPRVLL